MKMSLFYTVIFLLCAFCDSQEAKKFCHPYDETCTFISSNRGFKAVISGIPSIGIDVTDPLVLDFVKGNFPEFHYVWYNTTVRGLKSCEVQNVHIDFAIGRLYYELACPRIYMYGLYEANGYLLETPVTGRGVCNIVMYELQIKVEGGLRLIKDTDEQAHMYVDKYYTQYVPRGAVLMDFENLRAYNTSDFIRVAINRNSKQVALAYQNPVLDAIMRKVMDNVNKYFQAIPLNELFYE